MTVVTDEEEAQVERLKYVLANGVKEDLVERVCEWLGVHSAESVVLSPIPCWAHLPADRYRERIKTLVEEVGAEAAQARQRSDAEVLGVEAILAQDPQARPASVARSPAPLVHAATKAARKMFHEIYAAFVSAFRAAAEALRQGRRDVSFPAGSFPPALPFVPS